MNLREYQEEALSTAIYPTTAVLDNELVFKNDVSYIYPLIGLAGEVGELCNKLKKNIRDDKSIDVEDLKAELGDVLWYVALLADEYGIDLQATAEYNIKKLKDRKLRGVISGDGDKR